MSFGFHIIERLLKNIKNSIRICGLSAQSIGDERLILLCHQTCLKQNCGRSKVKWI